MIAPTMPGSGPRTPPSAQDGATPGAGSKGNTQAWQGVPRAGSKRLTCPSHCAIAPETSGTRAATAARLTSARVSQPSVPSSTRSYSAMRSSAMASVSRRL